MAVVTAREADAVIEPVVADVKMRQGTAVVKPSNVDVKVSWVVAVRTVVCAVAVTKGGKRGGAKSAMTAMAVAVAVMWVMLPRTNGDSVRTSCVILHAFAPTTCIAAGRTT